MPGDSGRDLLCMNHDIIESRAKKKGAIISWGSPDIVIKTNNITFDIYDLEVREIVPPQF